MKNWGRILLVTFLLLGVTTSFGFWSVSQFDKAFEDLTASSHTVITQNVDKPQVISEATSTIKEASSTPIVIEDLDPNFKLVFAPDKDEVYAGCTYKISWQASTTIESMEIALIDAGTLKSSGPVASGLSRENVIEVDNQNLEWKVGSVWPGEYFIEVLNVNGVTTTKDRSRKFMINRMLGDLDTDKKEELCNQTGGIIF